MSAECMGWVYRFSPAKGATLMVHLALADAANDLHGYEIWMRQATLAEKCRMTRRTVNTALAWLVDEGLLEVLEESRRHTANRYRFLMPIGVPVWDPSAHLNRNTFPSSSGLGVKSVQLGVKQVHTSDGLGEKPFHTEPKEIYNPSKTQNTNNAREAFDTFWDTYPRKAGKGQARKAWATAITKTDPQSIVDAALVYRNDPNRTDQFTPHPATWLNGERWDDDPLPSSTTSNNTRTRQPIEEWWDRSEPSGDLEL